MKLLTKELKRKLQANWDRGGREDHDPVPVVKFFNPCGAATWLFTELNPADGDTLFGLCDLGFGEPEIGYASLQEIASVKTKFGLKIERDLWFKGNKPLSQYFEEAKAMGRIVA